MRDSAFSLKIEITGLDRLAEAILSLAGAFGGAEKQKTTLPQEPTTTVSVQPTMPVQTSTPVQQAVPVQTAMPIPQSIPVTPVQQPVLVAPMQQPVPPVQQLAAPIPTTAVPVTHTYDELAVAASQLVNIGKQARLFEILKGFGVASLMELPQEKYAPFAGCLKAEGVKF